MPDSSDGVCHPGREHCTWPAFGRARTRSFDEEAFYTDLPTSCQLRPGSGSWVEEDVCPGAAITRSFEHVAFISYPDHRQAEGRPRLASGEADRYLGVAVFRDHGWNCAWEPGGLNVKRNGSPGRGQVIRRCHQLEHAEETAVHTPIPLSSRCQLEVDAKRLFTQASAMAPEAIVG